MGDSLLVREKSEALVVSPDSEMASNQVVMPLLDNKAYPHLLFINGQGLVSHPKGLAEEGNWMPLLLEDSSHT